MSEAAAGPPEHARHDVPDAFLPRLEAWLPLEEAADREAALEAGLRALATALRPVGRERGGAFDLLAADALLTRACEAAALEPDPEATLQAILDRVTRARP